MTTVATHPAPTLTVRRSRVGWTVVVLSAIAIVAFSVLPYLTASLTELAAQGYGLAGAYADDPLPVRVAFYVHIVFGSVALLAGPLQFSSRLRRRRRRLHRAIGRVYLGSVAVAAVMSLVLAPFNTAGMVGFFGFGTLGVLWLWTGRRAYRAIRTGDVPSHQAWMIRNYAITYAAVTLRVLFALYIAVQLPFMTITDESVDAAMVNAYAAVPFTCWLVNLVVAEWLIRRRDLPTLQLVAPPARPAPPSGA